MAEDDVRNPEALSDLDWQETLTPEQYRVMRRHGTERAFTGPYWDDHRPGTYLCAACGEALFDAATKYDSGSGWPSFWQPLAADVVGLAEDDRLATRRVEVHCARCGGHLGHVFPDGPRPTGLRYCMNGTALKLRLPDGSIG